MLKWLHKLFVPTPNTKRDVVVEHVRSLVPNDFKDVSLKYEDRVSRALLFFVGKQILLIGHEMESVPAVEPYISKNCRGYLLGVAHEIIICLGQQVDKWFSDNLVQSSFVLAYGREAGPRIASQTVKEFGPGSGLAVGYMHGSHEVEAVFHTDATGITSGVGFDLFANSGSET